MQPVAVPVRPAAGPVVRLTASETAADGQLATLRRRAPAEANPQAANPQAAFLQRSLVDGAPLEAMPGRADDFAWPRR